MTPQELDTREERGDNRLSTADLVAANGTNGSSTPAMAKAAQEPNLPLFAQNDTQDFRSRWEKIQIGFVDEPRTAVEQARRTRGQRDQTAGGSLCHRASQAGGGMGQDRQRFDGRPPRRAPPVPVLLRPALVCLASMSRSKPTSFRR